MREAILAIIVNRAKEQKIKKEIIHSGIINSKEYLDYALENNYIRISTPLENIENSTLKNIKLALKESGLKQAGEKEEIKERLKENGNIEVINRIFVDSIYKLTEKGEKLLKDRDYAIFYDNHEMSFYPNISLKDVETKILIEKKDIMTAFEELFEKAKTEKEFMNDIILNSEIRFYKEVKSWDKYIEKLFLYCYIQLSGVLFSDYCESYSKLPKYEVIELKNIQYELEYDNEKMNELYYKAIKDNDFKIKRFSDKEAFNLITRALDVGADKINEEIKVENARVIDIETGRDAEEVRKELYSKIGLKFDIKGKDLSFFNKIKKIFKF